MRCLHYTLYLVALCVVSRTVYAQNALPSIKNVRIEVESANKQLTVFYDVEDPENDDLKITVKILNRWHNYIEAVAGQASGDLGFPVKPGKNRKMVWNYPDSINNINEYHLKILADDLYKVSVQEIVNKVTAKSLSESIGNIYGIRSHDKGESLIRLNEVRDYITVQYKTNGVFTFRQKAPVAAFNVQNIIGRMEGLYDDKKTYILCAHYDSETKGPGADDNASGVVGMIEAMRVLSDYSFANSIHFVGLDGEEIGHLGSKLYVRKAKNRQEKIEGVINFDMIGFYSEKKNTQRIPFGYETMFPEAIKAVLNNDRKGNFILNTANQYSESLGAMFTASAGKYVPDLKVVSLVTKEHGQQTPELAASDHLQFWRGDYKAIHLGDGGATRNSNLDTKKDVLETLNFQFIEKVVKAAVATIAELAEVKHCVWVELAMPADQ
jgi:hypothetical protein